MTQSLTNKNVKTLSKQDHNRSETNFIHDPQNVHIAKLYLTVFPFLFVGGRQQKPSSFQTICPGYFVNCRYIVSFFSSKPNKIYYSSCFDLKWFGSRWSSIKPNQKLRGSSFLNSLHPNISMHILHTVLYTFPKVLTRRICLLIKSFFHWWPFPLLSWPQCAMHCGEKLDADHSKGLYF